MANTRIQLHSSGTTTNQPSLGVLANGEIALNFADGIIYYKTDANALGEIKTTTPSGLDTEIQFNDGGDFGANSGLTFTKGTGTLAVGTSLTVNSVDIPERLDSVYIHANAAFAAANSGGITGFTAADNTSSPNDTVNAASLTVNSSSTNADIVLEPKGTGAFLTHIPGGDAATGNKRGAFAIDLQLNRTDGTPAAGNVPSAYGATIIAGYDNKIAASGSGTDNSNSATVSRGAIIASTGSTVTSASSGTQYQIKEAIIIGSKDSSLTSTGATSYQSIIAGGSVHTINGHDRGGIFSGRQATLGNGDYSTIVGGYLHNVDGSYNNITGGQDHQIDSTATYSGIHSGSFNETEGD